MRTPPPTESNRQPSSHLTKRILVCLDASPRAPLVLALAVEIARRHGARLVLLRVVGLPAHVDQDSVVHAERVLADELVARAVTDLWVLAEQVPSRLFEGIDVHLGAPWDTICREAVMRDCDLVVLGSHPHSLLGRAFGNTASKVVNNCDRPVFFVRTPAIA
ncbi:MAG: universal stress protein [Polyangiaceae bacterium]|nr:universal stress protein [Polyangiaceae bacterium]